MTKQEMTKDLFISRLQGVKNHILKAQDLLSDVISEQVLVYTELENLQGEVDRRLPDNK